MKLDHIFFTNEGCLVEIDGVPCQLDTKFSVLRAGGCVLRAIKAKDQDKMNDLMSSVVGAEGDDWQRYACTDPRLVMLDIRCAEWRGDDDNAPWVDTAQAAPSQDEAMQFILAWLAQPQPQPQPQ